VISITCALHERAGFDLKKYFSTCDPMVRTRQPCKTLFKQKFVSEKTNFSCLEFIQHQVEITVLILETVCKMQHIIVNH